MIPPHPSPVGPHVMLAGHACGMHVSASPMPHTPGLPPPPQVAPPVQVPHELMIPPQPSPVGPHVTVGGQGCLVHPVVQTPAMHASVTGQVAHVSRPPHPLGTSPHTSVPPMVGQVVSGVHAVQAPLTQVLPVGHVAQVRNPPQPFGTSPQTSTPPLVGHVVIGVHVGGGRFESVFTHEERSSSMYSSASSCGVSAPVAQSVGVVVPPP
jgi:hypothetical protein